MKEKTETRLTTLWWVLNAIDQIADKVNDGIHRTEGIDAATLFTMVDEIKQITKKGFVTLGHMRKTLEKEKR